MSEMTAPLFAAREVALAQARTLARHGRYAEAEELLTGAWQDGAEPSVAALDLLARIHAQQGHLEKADRYWAEAERLAPGTREFTEGRARIAAMRAMRGGRASAGLVRRVGVPLMAVLMLALLVDIWLDSRKSEPEPSAASSAAPTATPSADRTLDGMNLQVPGVRLRQVPGEVSVTFERGLFRNGAALSADGREVLNALGARLRPYANRVDIAVIGHTDNRAMRPGGDYANNTELGIVRATVVREVLHDAARIPTVRFSVSTLGGLMPPFRDGDAGDARARNRTVSLRISAVGGR